MPLQLAAGSDSVRGLRSKSKTSPENLPDPYTLTTDWLSNCGGWHDWPGWETLARRIRAGGPMPRMCSVAARCYCAKFLRAIGPPGTRASSELDMSRQSGVHGRVLLIIAALGLFAL